jgi:hypothetical protein
MASSFRQVSCINLAVNDSHLISTLRLVISTYLETYLTLYTSTYDSSAKMGGDPAQINRSLGTIRTELEYLANSGVLSPPQFQSIQAQLPVSDIQNLQHAKERLCCRGDAGVKVLAIGDTFVDLSSCYFPRRL